MGHYGLKLGYYELFNMPLSCDPLLLPSKQEADLGGLF